MRAAGPGRMVVLTGSFLSGIFVLLGIVGIIALGPRVQRWREAAHWSTAPGVITAAEVVRSSGIRSRGARPVFEYEFRLDGGELAKGRGYDLLEVYTSDNAAAHAALKRYPVGSTVELLVDPADPRRRYITRGSPGNLVVYAVPPLFLVLGTIGAIYTIAGARGAFAPENRSWFARANRAALAVLLRERVLKGIIFGAFGIAIGLLLWLGIRWENPVLFAVAAVLGWGLWNASRKRRR